VNAFCQSTLPLKIGIVAERNASTAEAVAIGIARRITHFTPQRLTNVKKSTMHVASRGIGTHGRYH